MLIYSKKNDEGKLRLFGTLENVPATDDAELVYKNAEGTEVEIQDGDTYVSKQEDGGWQVYRKSDDSALIVYIKSADGTLTKAIGIEAEASEGDEAGEETTEEPAEDTTEETAEETVAE